MNATSDFTFLVPPQSAPMNHFENRSLRQGLYFLSLFSLSKGRTVTVPVQFSSRELVDQFQFPRTELGDRFQFLELELG